MVSVKAITVRFHLTHPAEKQAWDKLLSLRNERHQSFSQAITDAVNAYETDGNQLVQAVTESVTLRLQQMLPAYLAGYSAGAGAPITATAAPVHSELPQPTTPPRNPEPDDTMPDFGNSCMDFDFIGG